MPHICPTQRGTIKDEQREDSNGDESLEEEADEHKDNKFVCILKGRWKAGPRIFAWPLTSTAKNCISWGKT